MEEINQLCEQSMCEVTSLLWEIGWRLRRTGEEVLQLARHRFSSDSGCNVQEQEVLLHIVQVLERDLEESKIGPPYWAADLLMSAISECWEAARRI